MKQRQKQRWLIVAAIVSAGVALVGALGMQDRLRTVDILTLFFGGLGSGASIASAVAAARRRPNIFPALKYQDGPAALAWLSRTFGFTKLTEMPNPDGGIAHAELKLGPGVVMLGSVGKPDPTNPWSTAPQGLYVYVENIDAHFERARAAGATIVRVLHDTSYGSREYSATDLEGRLWSFGTYYPEN